MDIKKTLRGTGCAVVTPFTQSGEVDYSSLGKLLDHLIGNGVNYIVSLGTTGETPVLTSSEKKKIAQFTAKHINKRVPLVIGIGGNNTEELVQTLKEFPPNDAVAVLSASPYYNKPSQEGLYQHYLKLAEISPRPVILYNVPGRTGRNMSAETTLRLASHPNIAGIKEASGDMVQCMEIMRNCPADFLVVSGDDALALPQIACGMQGVISVAANCFPADFSAMVNAALDHNFKTAKELNDKLMPAYDLMFAENNPAGAKAFLAEMGIIQNIVRLPVVPLSESLHVKVKKFLGK